MASFSPADPSNAAASGFSNSATGNQYAGRVFTTPNTTELLPVGDPTQEENFRRIQERLRQFKGKTPELYEMFPGGAYVTGLINSAVGDDGDVHFVHNLGRIPRWIVFSVDLGGLGGQVQGIPAGGIGASGGNFHRWTATDIYVRATVASTYAFVIL
jgi:hypothetical protein